MALFLIRYYQLSTAMKWVGVAHGVNVLSLVVGHVMKLNGSKNNLFIFHFALIFVYAAFANGFYFALKIREIRRLLMLSVGVFSVAAVGFMLTIQPLSQYNSYALTLANVLLISWSLVYLYAAYSEMKLVRLERDPFFWVSVGLLFTSLGNFFANGLMSYLIRESRPYAYKVYLLEEVMTMVLFVILCVAVLADRLFRAAN